MEIESKHVEVLHRKPECQHILACIEREISFSQQHHRRKLLWVAREFPMESNPSHQTLSYDHQNQSQSFISDLYLSKYFSARCFVGVRSAGGNER